MAEKPGVKIVLTPEQQEQVRKATGKQIRSVKLEWLEARLTPGNWGN